jgi:phospholipid/cholesterol/gamma-HCH transport system ATP-binding protein
MPQRNDLSRSDIPLEQQSTLIAVVEMSQSSWLVAGIVPGLERHPLKKLALVGLGDFADYYPAEISGGMRKRAAIARAMALDPAIVFLDEPSAGLDPLTSRRLDDLLLELRASLGTTFVVVTHELASIFAIADDSVFLDPATRGITARGDPKRLVREAADPTVRAFLTRGEVTP